MKKDGTNYIYHYIYRDHLGNNRLVYADLDGNGVINPATEIIEENNYYPFGLKHQGYNNLPGDGYKYKYNGKEYEDNFGLNIYEMDLRQYDPAIGRWTVMDPITHHDYSPYSAFDNNPVYWSDPSGADSQKYITLSDLWNKAGSGITTYTFENGVLTGESHFKSLEAFLQNFFEIATPDTDGDGEGDGGSDGNGDPGKGNQTKYKSYGEWYQKVLQHKFLNNFSFEDAIFHYNYGKGEPVTVNLSTLNFDDITVERFLKSKRRYQDHPSITVNFLGSDYKGYRKEQGLIYGNITLVYIGNNTIMALPDQYNFEMHGSKISMRNILTAMGGIFNGYGTPYHIYFQGTAKIKTK